MTRAAGKANGKAGEKTARRIQATIEGARQDGSITWQGKKFRLEPGEPPGFMFILLGHLAANDMTTADDEAAEAIWLILETCLKQPEGVRPGLPGHDPATWDPGDFKAFQRHAMLSRAKRDEIFEAVGQVVEVYTARPTNPPSGSSDGQPAGTENSTGSSSGAPAAESSG